MCKCRQTSPMYYILMQVSGEKIVNQLPFSNTHTYSKYSFRYDIQFQYQARYIHLNNKCVLWFAKKTYDLYSNILFFLTLRISMSLNRLYLLHHMLNLERLFYLALLYPIGRSCQNFSSNIYSLTCILLGYIYTIPSLFAPNIKSLFFS